MMKVIHCLNHFLPDRVAGTEIYALMLAKSLCRFDIESLIVIPGFEANEDEEYVIDRVRVIKYAASKGDVNNRTGLNRFQRILQNERPDIVQFHEFTLGRGITVKHITRAKQLGIKTVMTFHIADYTCLSGSLVQKDGRLCAGLMSCRKCAFCTWHTRKMSSLQAVFLYGLYLSTSVFRYNLTRINKKLGTAISFPAIVKQLKSDLLKATEHCDKIVTLTDWYRLILEKNGIPSSQITVISQGLANKENRELLPDKSVSRVGAPLKVMFIGRITSFKGVDLLIEAVCRLSGKPILLDIYGKDDDGDYALSCKKQSENQENICWKGALAPALVLNTMQEYDVLCLPSAFSEMSPLVIQEAFAAGIPVLASNVYGNAEQIKDGINGWLFKFKDSVDLTDKLQFLIDNKEKIAEAKKNIPETKSFDEVAKEYSDLYKLL
jgi:glycosyltransferase involved in cell wall biosynthesis